MTPRDPYDWTWSWAWPLLGRGPLPGCADLVLLGLAAHANRDGVAWPSTRTLGKLVGHGHRGVRDAIEKLRDLGYIDGTPSPGKVTRWQLVSDENEQRRLRELRTRDPQFKPIPAPPTVPPVRTVGVVPTAAQLRGNCGATVPPVRTEVEVEVEVEENPLSLQTEASYVGERAASNLKQLLASSLRMPADAAGGEAA